MILDLLLFPVVALKRRMQEARVARRWRRLRALGMEIGKEVNLPASTFIDDDHCFLISIGDRCGFGEECHILAHDAQMDEYLDAARLGRVTIRESCHIGARTIILAGVEIGPRTIVGAGSVVTRSLPPNTVCAGAPAKVICSLDEYLDRHRLAMKTAPTFDYRTHSIGVIRDTDKAAMKKLLESQSGYMVGGYALTLKDVPGG